MENIFVLSKEEYEELNNTIFILKDIRAHIDTSILQSQETNKEYLLMLNEEVINRLKNVLEVED